MFSSPLQNSLHRVALAVLHGQELLPLKVAPIQPSVTAAFQLQSRRDSDCQMWEFSSLLRGIKRGNGVTVSPRAPLIPKHLSQTRDMFRLDRLADLQFWAATLCAFFGLLRIGNLTPPHSETRQDLSVTKKGTVLYIRRSKTIQFGERTHSVVLPYLPGNHLCPVSTLLCFLGRRTSCALDAPLFSIMDTAGRMVPLSAGAFRQRLHRVTSSCPQIAQCSTHSLHKGGATWLLSCNVPLAAVHIIGDWSSDAVF